MTEELKDYIESLEHYINATPTGQMREVLTTANIIIQTLGNDNDTLRRLLWLRHGCDTGALYGDDGEMQCGHCIMDFKRMPAQEIENRWHTMVLLKLKTSDELKEELNKLFPKDSDDN